MDSPIPVDIVFTDDAHYYDFALAVEHWPNPEVLTPWDALGALTRGTRGLGVSPVVILYERSDGHGHTFAVELQKRTELTADAHMAVTLGIPPLKLWLYLAYDYLRHRFHGKYALHPSHKNYSAEQMSVFRAVAIAQ